MRKLTRLLSIAALICLPYGARAGAGGCEQKSLQILKASSPDGFAIYKQTTQPSFFRGWIDCSDAQFDLSTAVHESTHFVTSETDAFPLVGGGAIKRPHEVSEFFPPYRIAKRFKADSFTTIYLRKGKASSSTDFMYLLDEFNAYTHDLNVAVDLKRLRSREITIDHRDGLAAMMAFVATYAEIAEASEPETWQGLKQPPVRATIATLWKHAEGVMASSCGIPNYGSEDKAYIRQVCAAGPHSALAQLLGRTPACPTACLAAEPESEPTSDDDVTASIPHRDEQTTDDEYVQDTPRHPFASQAGPRRHKLRPQTD